MNSTRANWAAVAGSVDFANIRNLPSDSPFVAPDISQVGGRGFANGQVPTWSSSQRKFLPATPSSSGGAPTPTSAVPWQQITFFWDAPELLPLQSCYEDFDFIGALTSDAVAAGPLYELEYCQVTASVPEMNKVRVIVTNMAITSADLSNGIWKIVRFPTV